MQNKTLVCVDYVLYDLKNETDRRLFVGKLSNKVQYQFISWTYVINMNYINYKNL